MTRAVEDSALSRREEFSTELAPTYAAAAIEAEIQSAITIALKFPRNEDKAFEKLMRACKRPSFAEDASYRFPRGKTQDADGKWVDNIITGPSVNLAREAARVWGNIRFGLEIIRDDEESRQIRGWAWDLESNTKTSAEDDFKKLIYRKAKGWIKPDERDLRELTNRRGSILIRNAILSLLPKDLIEDAIEMSDSTRVNEAATDPEGARKKVILGFSEINVTPQMLEEYLGHPLGEASPAEIANLRTIYRSIADGNSTWPEYVHSHEPENGKPPNGKATGPARINEEQAIALNAIRQQANCPGEKMTEILNAHGAAVIAQVTVDKYEAVADAVSKWNVTDAPAAGEKPSEQPVEQQNSDVREKQRVEIDDLILALEQTGHFTHNQAIDIIEVMVHTRDLKSIPDAQLPNVKIRLEAELKKTRKRK